MSSLKNPYGLNKDAEKPVIKCIYHKDQIVTNFCSSTECMHPLCPVCVAHHIQDHKNYRDFAQFDTYDEVLDRTNTEINDFLRTLKVHKDKLDTLEVSLKDQEANLKQQLNVAHNKAKVLLDDYFRTLESELNAALQVSRDKFNTEKLKTYEKLQEKAEINVNYATGLYNSDKSVRSLLTYLHNDVKQQNEKFVESLGDMSDFKTLEVATDSSKLHEIHVQLSKFVEIKNIPISSEFQTLRRGSNNNVQNFNNNHLQQQAQYSNSIAQNFNQTVNSRFSASPFRSQVVEAAKPPVIMHPLPQQVQQQQFQQQIQVPLQQQQVLIRQPQQQQVLQPRSQSRVQVSPNTPAVVYELPSPQQQAQQEHLQQQYQLQVREDQRRQENAKNISSDLSQQQRNLQQQQQILDSQQLYTQSRLVSPQQQPQQQQLQQQQRQPTFSPYQSQSLQQQQPVIARPLSPVRVQSPIRHQQYY